MDATLSATDGAQTRLRVSFIARLISLLAFTIPLIGGAMSSLLLMGMFRALSKNENAGMAAIMAGMKEASVPVIVSLYLAAFFGVVAVVVMIARALTQTKTASPPFWFFLLGGILCFIPAALFWKAQLMVLDVLSPGSSAGAAGISGVVSDITMLLSLSMFSAPIVFVLLLVPSVVPFSSRPGPKAGSIVTAALAAVLLVTAAVAVPFLIDGPKRKNEIVSLPANVKNAVQDAGIEKESSLVLTLTADGKLHKRQTRDVNGRVERTEAAVTDQELPGTIERSMEDKTPDRRIVYFKCDINASYESVLKVFEAIRKADVDKVGLVVIGPKDVDDPYQTAPVMYEVRLQEPIDTSILQKPNPLMLVVALEKNGELLRNNSPTGTIANTRNLEDSLFQVFKERENNGVFREGTNEIEKKTYIKASKSTKYGDFIRLVEAVKTAGAQPIGIQIDDVN